MGALSGKLYAVGGLGDESLDGALADMEVFDGKAWTAGPSMITGRFQFGLVAFGDKLYAVGGADAIGSPLASVEIFDGSSWSAGPAMLTARRCFGLAFLGGSLHAAGGMDTDSDAMDQVERLDDHGNSSAVSALLV